MSAVSCVLIGAGLVMFWQQDVALDWPSTHGTIVYSKVERSLLMDDGGAQFGKLFNRQALHFYRPAVRYQYEVDGKQLIGTRVGFASGRDRDPKVIEYFLLNYPVGGPVRVHYDPVNPANSRVGIPVSATPVKLMGIGLSALVICAFVWFRETR